MFGHAATTARLATIPRSRAWRTRMAGTRVGVAIVAAGPLALLPPHTVWSIGALIFGFVVARNRWAENQTVAVLELECPRCGAAREGRAGVRLKVPHPVECEACGHTGQVTFPSESLPALP